MAARASKPLPAPRLHDALQGLCDWPLWLCSRGDNFKDQSRGVGCGHGTGTYYPSDFWKFAYSVTLGFPVYNIILPTLKRCSQMRESSIMRPSGAANARVCGNREQSNPQLLALTLLSLLSTQEQESRGPKPWGRMAPYEWNCNHSFLTEMLLSKSVLGPLGVSVS